MSVRICTILVQYLLRYDPLNPGVVVVLANSLGPIIGGVFTQTIGWRWWVLALLLSRFHIPRSGMRNSELSPDIRCFYINLPLSALSLILVTFLLPLRHVKGSVMSKLRRLDYYGSILTLAWAVAVLLALSWAGNQYPWVSIPVLLPLCLGIALLGLFIYIEIKVMPLPLIPFHILRNKTVAATMVATLFSGFAFYSTLYYLPQYFQIVRGASAIRSGVLILPLVLVQTTAAFFSGFLVSRTGEFYSFGAFVQ